MVRNQRDLRENGGTVRVGMKRHRKRIELKKWACKRIELKKIKKADAKGIKKD